MTDKKLVIVESPAKAKTINKYLGKDFIVLASFGHVRDLPKKNGSIDIANGFTPKYQIIARNKKHVDEIREAALKCGSILLATDPDREGEAIAWHITEILRNEKKLNNIQISRVAFHEVTQNAIMEAISKPRSLNTNLIEAQQARLTLDYLLGFNLSPLLWKKIKPGLSAGRVQSPALRLICEREKEIQEFAPEKYFSLHLYCHKDKAKIYAKLIEYQTQKIDTKTINKLENAQKILDSLSKNTTCKVINIAKKQKKKNPYPPFMTSTLQIEAARKLGFNTEKTMKVAQSLYEGVDLESDTIGLITYMRTDSVSLAKDSVTEIRNYISQNYKPEYLPQDAINYTNKVKNAQEAHEAIRPTSINRTPSQIKKYLSLDQYKLYELIWLRTLASQLSSAILDLTSVDIQLGDGIFRANGLVVNFDGFMKIYQEELEESNSTSKAENQDQAELPELKVGEVLTQDKVEIEHHQTEPKPRYSEASLVKALEDLGIGRPSTYASIISTLKKREYVLVDKKRFVPTDIGIVVSNFLTTHLTKYVDFAFTAHLEDTLDHISNGSEQKLPVLSQFWQDLSTTITEKEHIARTEVLAEKIDEKCPECGKDLLKRLGKYGKFIGCSGYPECHYMRKLETNGNNETEEQKPLEKVEGRKCPKDEGDLVIRVGRYGKFISCNNYPKCKYIESLDKSTDELSVECPGCKKGSIVPKKNRYGNWFYACNNYPECKTLFNHKPINEKCPNCSYPLLLNKITKSKGNQKVCPKCDFETTLEKS